MLVSLLVVLGSNYSLLLTLTILFVALLASKSMGWVRRTLAHASRKQKILLFSGKQKGERAGACGFAQPAYGLVHAWVKH